MNMLGHRLGIACVAILSALALAHASGAEPLVAPPAGGLVRISPVSPKPRAARVVPSESLALKGISTMGTEPVALLSVKPPSPIARPTALDVGLERGHWLAAGDLAYGYTVKVIAKDHMILVRSDTVAEIKVPLASSPVTMSDPKPYSKAWINSRANPMLFHAQYMPGRMLGGAWDQGNRFGGAWDQLSYRKKAQVLKFYRKHGWQLIPVKTGPGPTEFEWRNHYEAERTAAIEANREKFERTLTPEQLGLWKQMRGFQIIYGLSKAQQELMAAQQRIRDEFRKSLTPEQKAEHEGIPDFTKASWK